MYVCMYVMYVCMYVCMYVFMCVEKVQGQVDFRGGMHAFTGDTRPFMADADISPPLQGADIYDGGPAIRHRGEGFRLEARGPTQQCRRCRSGNHRQGSVRPGMETRLDVGDFFGGKRHVRSQGFRAASWLHYAVSKGGGDMMRCGCVCLDQGKSPVISHSLERTHLPIWWEWAALN